MDDQSDHPGLYFQFPLWTLVHQETSEALGEPDSLILLNDPETGERLFSLFTDEDLGERFIVGTKMVGIVLLAIESPASLLEWRDGLQAKGINHVSVDSSASPGQQESRISFTAFFEGLEAGEDRSDSG